MTVSIIGLYDLYLFGFDSSLRYEWAPSSSRKGERRTDPSGRREQNAKTAVTRFLSRFIPLAKNGKHLFSILR